MYGNWTSGRRLRCHRSQEQKHGCKSKNSFSMHKNTLQIVFSPKVISIKVVGRTGFEPVIFAA
jgi:hypothetical protein